MAQTSTTISDDNEELGAFAERGIAFVAKVKNSISGGKIYQDFVGVLEMSQKGSIKDIKNLLDNVDAVFAHHQELYEEFHALFFHEEHENRAAVCGQKALKTYVTRKRKSQEEEEKIKKFAQDFLTTCCFSDKTRDSNETCTASYKKDIPVVEYGQEALILERLNSAIENLKLLEEAMNQNPSPNSETINTEDYLTPIDLKCIDRLLDDHEDVEIRKSLRSNPKSVLGDILDKLKDEKEVCEVILAIPSYIENFNKQQQQQQQQ